MASKFLRQAMRVVDFTGQNMPTPSPSWVNRVAKSLAATFFGIDGIHPVPIIPERATITDNANTGDAAVDLTNLWKVFTDRKRTVMDIDNMDRNDGVISAALDVIADQSCTYDASVNYRLNEDPTKVKATDKGFEQGFRVVASDPKVQVLIDELIVRLDLSSQIWQIVRKFVKFGVYLPEVVLDPKDPTKIIALNDTEPHEIWPNVNEKGHKQPGWIYRRDRDVYASTTGNAGNYLVTAGTAMAEWQIVPFEFGAKDGFFTAPLLGSVRYDWKRLQAIDDGMAITRLRSTDRYVHHVPIGANATPEEVEAILRNYMQRINKRRILGPDQTLSYNESPYTAQTEIFLPQQENNPMLGKVDILNPSNAHLGNLTDVYYQREKVLARLSVPITYLQIMSTQKTHLTAAAGLQGVEKQFSKFLMRCQESLRRGLTRLIDLHLTLNGVLPQRGIYSIELPIIVTKDALNDAKISLANAQAAVYFTEAFGALPMNLLADLFLTLTTEQQEVLSAFAKTYNDRVVNAKIEALEMNAQPPTGPLGVAKAKGRVPGATGTKKGGAGKSLGERSSEQKGASLQSITVDEAMTLYASLAEGVEQALLSNGVDPNSIPTLDFGSIRASLQSIAINDES